MTQDQLNKRVADLMAKSFIAGMAFGVVIVVLGFFVGRAVAS
jgi:hypothetical protein